MDECLAKENKLLDLLAGLGSALVAFSGGVDSTYLAWAARRALGDSCLAVLAVGPTLPGEEERDARHLAESLNLNFLTVHTREMDDPEFLRNAPDRCYHCKRALFAELSRIGREKGLNAVLTGENVDDATDYRPGRRAAEAFGVRHPLREAGLTKRDIRSLSARAGLPTAAKPAAACLASRIPYGTPVSAPLLTRIGEAEAFLKAQGFSQYRLRHHGDVCRIELLPAEMGRLMEPARRQLAVDTLKALGYRYITLDLQGYRTGSLNEALDPAVTNPSQGDNPSTSATQSSPESKE